MTLRTGRLSRPVNLPNPSSILDTLQTIPSGTWVTAGGAALVAFLAGLAFARGVIKQLFGMLCLAIAVLVALYVFRHRSVVFGSAGATMSTDKLMIFAASAGLLTYFVCRFLIHILAGMGLLNMLGGLAGWKGLMLSVIPSGFLLWVGSMTLRLTGNVSGVENTAEVARAGPSLQGKVTSWLHQFSQQVDRSVLGSLAEKFDPLDLRATANLSRLLILWPDGTAWQRLAYQSPKNAQLLGHPKIRALGQDPKVRQAIDRQDFAGLMQLPQVEQAASDPELQPFLEGLALEEAMDAIVYKQPTKRR
ncbi:MAG: CvpA family protein [Prosthecobacter sp.]|nr:CvpA family protein [Prosthecobacter sp.]